MRYPSSPEASTGPATLALEGKRKRRSKRRQSASRRDSKTSASTFDTGDMFQALSDPVDTFPKVYWSSDASSCDEEVPRKVRRRSSCPASPSEKAPPRPLQQTSSTVDGVTDRRNVGKTTTAKALELPLDGHGRWSARIPIAAILKDHLAASSQIRPLEHLGPKSAGRMLHVNERKETSSVAIAPILSPDMFDYTKTMMPPGSRSSMNGTKLLKPVSSTSLEQTVPGHSDSNKKN